MKQPSKSGRLLADVGEDLKRKLYKILFNKDMDYKTWLIKTVKEYVEREGE